MTIKSIKLVNFRSWHDYHLDFDDVTILIGPNGVGKTNILESIWMLVDGRSWRTNHDAEVIAWDNEFAKITAQIKNTKDIELELILQKSNQPAGGKTLKINGVRSRMIEVLGELPGVLFSPETIELINGAPALRRRFLDILLSQIDRNYALALLEYNKVLRARNHLLENIKHQRASIDELDFWDQKITQNGLFILKKRKSVIKFFTQNISQAYQDISHQKIMAKIIYHESAPEENFAEHLIANRERDISQGNTISGPHRDDWLFYLDSRDLSTFGSRGEFRTAVLALKILELRYIEEEKKARPILLLDDIFSELDQERRHHLSNIVTSQQTIITTTDLDHIDKTLRDKAKIVEIKTNL